MKKIFSQLWSDTVISRSLKVFLVIEGLFILLLGLFWSDLPPQLPLFYSLPRGTEQLVNTFVFTIIPILSLILMILNLIAGILLFHKYILLSRIIILSGTIVSFILFITFIKIILTII
ncbi:hypothetical protein HYW54_03460 [Candidatus Gottesmanbacteria bacterium]|nr:hypothetical protein [Candidatus Gottesmanbacteria bacterium]